MSNVPDYKYAKLIKLRCYKENTLFFVNENVFQYFREMENVMRTYLPYINDIYVDLKSFFRFKMSNITSTVIENCHNLLSKIMDRFIIFRMKMCCKKILIMKITIVANLWQCI